MAGVDLQEHRKDAAERHRLAVEQAEKLRAVHALDAVEGAGSELGLVRLEVADELPGHGGRGLGALLNRLLHAVFADRGQAVAGGPVHGFGRVRLGDGQQPYRSRRPARARAGFPDAGQDCVRPLLEFLKVGRRSGH